MQIRFSTLRSLRLKSYSNAAMNRRDYPDDDEDDDDYRDRDRRRRRDRDDRDIGDDAGMRMLLPVGRSGWAIAAGYLGLISVLCVPAPLALMAGILAVQDIRKNPKKHGMGRAIFGLIMGGLGSLLLTFALVSLGIAAFTKK